MSIIKNSITGNIEMNKLSSIRILQKNILYLIGLPKTLALPEILEKKEFLGQYGKIKKIIVNKNGYKKKLDKTYSAYITFSSFEETAFALLSIDNFYYEKNLLKTSFGTTKYCNFFLNGIQCINKDCLYLHNFSNENDMILKDDINNKKIFYYQQKIAVLILNIFDKEKKNEILKKGFENKKYFQNNNIQNFFPTVDYIYEKDIIYNIKKEIYFENCNLNNCNLYDNLYDNLNDDIEYILVKEPIKKNKKKYNKKYSKKYINSNLKRKDEKKIQNLNLNSSNSTSISNNSENNNSYDFKFNLFSHPEKSRFNFVKNENINTNEQLIIPNFIIKIIDIKYSSFSFFNFVKRNINNKYFDDNYLFSKEKKEIEEWNQSKKIF